MKMSKIVFMVWAICLLVCNVAFAEKTSGVCGDNMTWSYDAQSGVLTLDGTGDMYNYPVKYEEWFIGSEPNMTWVLHSIYHEYDYNVTGYYEYFVGPYEDGRWVIAEIGRPGVEMFIGDQENGKWELVYTDRPYEFVYAGTADNGEWLVAYTDQPYELVYIGDEQNGKWEVLYTNYEYIIEQIGFGDNITWAAVPTVPWRGLDIEKIVLTKSVTDICIGPLAGYGFEVEDGNTAFYSDENGVLYTKDKKTLISYPANSENTSYDIPDGVTKIEYGAFMGAENLESVSIPNSVKHIEEEAFGYCINLSDIDFPAKLDYLVPDAFDNTAWEENHPEGVMYAANFVIGYVFPDGYDGEPINLIIKDGTTHIADYVFEDAYITSVELPDSLESIGDYAFCYTGIESVIIPDSVKYIGNFAFRGCSSLLSINIPDSVKYLGTSAFECCSDLSSVTLGNGIETIAMRMFADCDSLTSIDIPDSVKSIEGGAFSGCDSLINIEFPSELEYIEPWAVANTAWWENHSDEVIYAANFALGYALTDYDYDKVIDLVIKDGTTHIAEYAFSGLNVGLLELPDSLESIGEGAFAYCSFLHNFKFPSSLKSIGEYAFEECYFDYIELPYGIETVGYGALNAYEYIVLPETIKEIDIERLYCDKYYVKAGSFAEELILEYNEENPEWELDFGYYYDVMLDYGVPGSKLSRAYKLDDRDMYVESTSECSGYIVKGWAEKANADESECLPDNMYTENKDTTLYAVLEKTNALYTMDYLNIFISNYYEEDLIPDTEMLIEVYFTNIASCDNDRFALASYDSDGRFLGIKLGISNYEEGFCDFTVDNTDGKIKSLKIFIFDDLKNMIPYAEVCEIKE